MKKYRYRSDRSRRDAKFIKFAISLIIGMIVLAIVVIFTTIQLDDGKEEKIEPDRLVIDTWSSHIIGPTVEAHAPETVSTSTEAEPEVGPVPCQELTPYIELTEDEKHMLATIIYLEGRGESVECQYAIGSVIINRVTTSGSDLKSVIYAEGQFEPAYLISSTTPTDTQIEIVNELCIDGPSLPEYVTYFRANHYHEWGDLSPYTYTDNTYFSYSRDVCYQVMSEAMAEEE